MKGFFIPVFIVLLLLPFSASATTYYVSRVDGNDNYNGRYPTYQGGSDGPWLTLAKSVASVSSGDTVYLRAGTWNEGLYIAYRSYTSTTTWARYPSDPVGSVILNGTGIQHEQWEDGVVFIKSTNYVRIDGIKVINGYKSGFCALNGQNIDIINCVSETTGRGGVEFWIVTNGKIQHNKIYYGCMPAGSEELISVADSTNIDVSYNEVYAGNRNFGVSGGEGPNAKGGSSYVYFHHNYVDMARPDGQDNDRVGMGCDAWTTEVHHIYFYNNIIKNSAWGLVFNSEEGGQAEYLYAWNNIIIHCGHCWRMHGGGIGLPSWGEESAGPVRYGYFWNNIIYDCYYGTYFNKEEINGEILVQNNIFYNSAVADIQWGDSPQGVITLDHNLLSTTNPKFVNASGGDFHLQSGSPAIDAGVTIPNVTDDFDGIARPQGVAYDIGAYEFSGGNCTGTCKTNPCNTYNNCTTGSGTCLTGYCCSGTCSLCGNTICELGETCSSCPQDCGCVSPQLCCSGVCSTPACSQNSDCGTNPCKVYTCNNPGTCSSACSSQDITSCINNDGCCPSGCNKTNDNDCGGLGTVAWYHFDEGFGTSASDSSGNGNDGTINGATWTMDSVSGNALEFDGNDYVSFGQNNLPKGTNPRTIMGWAKMAVEPTRWTWIAAYGTASSGRAFFIGFNNDAVYCGGYGDDVSSSFDLASYVNQWVYVACTYNGTNATLYFNGAYKASSTKTWNLTKNVAYIGRQVTGGEYFNGTIDEVRIYDRVLTEGEILQLYNNPGGESIPGDLDDDGDVDIDDLIIVTRDFGRMSGYDARADTILNGEIDIFDVVFVASRFT